MSLAQPAWLAALLLLPLLVTAAALAGRARSKQWAAFVAPRLRPRLLARSSPLPRYLSFASLLLALALLIIALARPQASSGRESETLLGRNIMFAIDLSRSMKVGDLKPDRLTQAKALAYELIEALPGDRLGVIGFAGSAYKFAPLTVDHAAVRETLAQLDTDWIPTGGSNLEGGLELAIESLKETGTRQNALVLLSDGEEHVGRVADLAEQARARGIKVIAIGLGTTEGDFVPDDSFRDGRFRDREGRAVVSRLEPEPLERIASVTGGRFAIAASGADIPAMVQAAVEDLDRVRINDRERTVTVEYFQWFLLPSILLMIVSVLAATRWRGVSRQPARATRSAPAKAAAILAALTLLGPPEARAASLDEARRALEEQRYEDAVGAFRELAERHRDSERAHRFHLALGEAAYRQQDWPTAREAFSQALRSQDPAVRDSAHHGLGNTLFEIGWARLSGGAAYPDTEDPAESQGPGLGEAFRRIGEALLGMLGDDPPEEEDDDLAAFEEMVKKRLLEWLQDPPVEGGLSASGERFHSLLSDWIDAVRHYDSAPDYAPARHNRDLTVRHLERLQQILEQLEQNAQQLQAIPRSGQGEPQQQPGEGQQPGDQEGEGGEEPQEGEGDSREGEEGAAGEQQGEEQPGGDGGQDEQRPDREGENEEEGEELGAKPGETPEEAARRILRENADLQKGALSPGRVRFSRPEKDW